MLKSARSLAEQLIGVTRTAHGKGSSVLAPWSRPPRKPRISSDQQPGAPSDILVKTELLF